MPSAVASTLVTNPVTFGPVYYAAWVVGNRVLGESPTSEERSERSAASGLAHPHASVRDQNWLESTWDRIAGVGKPLMLGLVLFAVFFGVAVWVLVHLLWRLHVSVKRHRRRRDQTR